jgi:hypothetical protein
MTVRGFGRLLDRRAGGLGSREACGLMVRGRSGQSVREGRSVLPKWKALTDATYQTKALD